MGIKKGEHLIGKEFETEEDAKAIIKGLNNCRIEFWPEKRWVILSKREPAYNWWQPVLGGLVRY